MKRDISDIMKTIANKQPLWKKQLANHKAQKIQKARRSSKTKKESK
jgi:hypothetical protein